MDVVVFVGLAAAVLALGAYIAGRRFGVLGLALAAGYVLSRLWEREIVEWAQYLPFESSVIGPVTVVMLAVILLPSIVLLFGGPRYRTKRGRVAGALLFGCLAVVFGLSAFEHSALLTESGRSVADTLLQYQQLILTFALGVSVIDVLYARTGKGDKSSKKH